MPTPKKRSPVSNGKKGVYEKGRTTRSLIIGKASHLFSHHGFDGTTLEDIAAACGLTRAVPYRYFGNKRDLYLCCLEASFANFEDIAESDSATASPREELERYLSALIRLLSQDVGFRKLLLRSIMEDDSEVIDQLLVRLFARPVGDLARRIRKLHPDLEGRTAANSLISIIVIDLETRKFGNRLKPQPRDGSNTSALLEHVLSIVDRMR